jgi:hypothetical protein
MRGYVAAEWYAQDAQREVSAFSRKIPDGATRQQVANIYAQGDHKYLRLVSDAFIDRGYCDTPSRMAAGTGSCGLFSTIEAKSIPSAFARMISQRVLRKGLLGSQYLAGE